jgi:hypothetical protein
MATKKRGVVDDGFAEIANRKRLNQPGQDEKTAKPNPLGVPLEQVEVDRLSEIAEELGLKRHHVMQYAIRQFLLDWEKGKRPKMKPKTVYELNPE